MTLMVALVSSGGFAVGPAVATGETPTEVVDTTFPEWTGTIRTSWERVTSREGYSWVTSGSIEMTDFTPLSSGGFNGLYGAHVRVSIHDWDATSGSCGRDTTAAFDGRYDRGDNRADTVFALTGDGEGGATYFAPWPLHLDGQSTTCDGTGYASVYDGSFYEFPPALCLSGAECHGERLTQDSDPDPRHLVGSTTWTRESSSHLSLANDVDRYRFTATYDLWRVAVAPTIVKDWVLAAGRNQVALRKWFLASLPPALARKFTGVGIKGIQRYFARHPRQMPEGWALPTRARTATTDATPRLAARTPSHASLGVGGP